METAIFGGKFDSVPKTVTEEFLGPLCPFQVGKEGLKKGHIFSWPVPFLEGVEFITTIGGRYVTGIILTIVTKNRLCRNTKILRLLAETEDYGGKGTVLYCIIGVEGAVQCIVGVEGAVLYCRCIRELYCIVGV